MKGWILCLVGLLLSTFLLAQVQPAAVHTQKDDKRKGPQLRMQGQRSTTTQVRDTLLLPYAKRTSNRSIFVNPSSSAASVAQVFESPIPVTVSGFEFFAFVTNAASTTPVDLRCAIYAVSGGLPSGNPLVTTTVRVRSNSNTTLMANRQEAIFPNPVVISGPFAVVLENPVNENVTLFTSNWDNNDGGGEFLPALLIGGNWLSASSVNVGGVPFDADFYMHPFVSYPFDHGFALSQRCLSGNDTIDITNTTPMGILQNRFLNRAIFDGTNPDQLIQYDFDNGQGWVTRMDTSVIYGFPQKYVLRQEVNLDLWASDRTFLVQDSIDVPPVAAFSFNQSGYRVNFQNTSSGIDDIVWNFGDSIFSTLLNPEYRYLRTGNFEVTLIISNGCGSDTATANVSIVPNSVNRPEQYQWQIAPNPTNGMTMIHWNSDHPVEHAQLLDIQGRLLQTWSTQPHQRQLPVDLSTLPKGTYLLHLFNEQDEYATIKLSRY